MQKIGAQYVAKRIYDSVLATPKPETDETEGVSAAAPQPEEKPAHDLDGQIVRDENGAELGTAHRIPGIAVYMVYDGYGSPRDQFDRLVEDPETRLYVQRDGSGRILGLIYVPDPSRLPQRPAGLRPDEV
ncbi:MAG TPA: hypothetical protein VIL01_15365 [Thermomicrobiales bacterium]